MSTNFSTSTCRAGRWLTASVIALVLCLSGFQQARADQPSREDIKAFKELVKKGSELRDADKPFEALVSFEEAREYVDHPKLAFNIGKLKEKTGACEQARDLYTDVLGREKLPDDLRVEVVEQLKSSKQCVSFGTLVMRCEPDGAAVALGKHEFGCPATKRVKPGSYEAVVSAPRHRETTVAVELKPGARVEHAVELEPAQEPEPASDMQADNSPTGEPEPADATPWMRYGAYGSVGLGAGLLSAALISDFGATSRQEAFVSANEAGDHKRAGELKQEAEAARARTIVLYSAGAVFAAGGVVLWTLDSRRPDESTPHVRAQLGWRSGGPALQGVLTW